MKRRGFSVIEILIASALAAMLLSAVVAGLMLVSSNVKANDASMRARQAGTRALELILSKVRRAKEITLLNTTGTDAYAKLVTLDDGTWNPTTSTFDDPKFTEFIFENGKLFIVREIDDEDAKQPILSNVDNLVFRSTRPDTSSPWRDVTVEISLASVQAFTADEKTTFAITGSSSVRSLEEH